MKEFDFLPPGYHRARRRRREVRQNLVWTLMVVTILGSAHVVNSSRVRSAQASVARLLASDSAAGSSAAIADSLRARKQILQLRAGLLDRLEDDAALDAIIGELTRLMSPNMALRLVELDCRPVNAQTTVTAPSTADKPITVDALAPQAPTRLTIGGTAANDIDVGMFYGKLSGCPLFENVQMKFSRSVQSGRNIREFEMTLTVKRVQAGN